MGDQEIIAEDGTVIVEVGSTVRDADAGVGSRSDVETDVQKTGCTQEIGY